MSRRQIAWFAAILFIVALLAGGAFSSSDLLEQFRLVTRVYSVIKANYVEKVDSKKLFVGACRGMAQSLGDPHTVFLDSEENTRFTNDTEGEFGGLGIEIGIKDGILTVMHPIPNTPAYEAGVLAGDRIIEIEGDSTEGIHIQEAVRRLRGKVGTKVTVTVLHPGSRDNTKITITRGKIKPSSLEMSMVDEKQKIGYIHVLQFSGHVDRDFREALNELAGKGMKGLILDLRGDPGGLLQMAVRLCDMFISKGVIVSVRGRRPEEKAVYTATAAGTLSDLPIVCLIDSGSASASEIVAGCLRDHKRALLVGTRSYGKGSVQKLFSIRPGGSLKLTTARYYTPNGKPIEDRKGILPDIVIPMTNEYIVGLRLQEREDKLRGHYAPGVSGLREKVETKPKPAGKDKKGAEKKDAKQLKKEREAQERGRLLDVQLKGALTILLLDMGVGRPVLAPAK